MLGKIILIKPQALIVTNYVYEQNKHSLIRLCFLELIYIIISYITNYQIYA